jgi:hypothetical protein
MGSSKVNALLGDGEGLVDSDPSLALFVLVDLYSSRGFLGCEVVNANCVGLNAGVPCAALARVAG